MVIDTPRPAAEESDTMRSREFNGKPHLIVPSSGEIPDLASDDDLKFGRVDHYKNDHKGQSTMVIDTPGSDAESDVISSREDDEKTRPVESSNDKVPELTSDDSLKFGRVEHYKSDDKGQSTMVIDTPGSDAENTRMTSCEDDEKTRHVEPSSDKQVPELAWDDVQVGRLLGQGGFANVNEAVLKSGEGKDKQVYAIKHLKDSVMEKRAKRKIGVQDLVIECKFLSRLQHEHIVKLHGISDGLLSDRYKYDADRIFLLLDLLPGSLIDKIGEWRLKEEHTLHLPRFGGLWESEKIRLYERMRAVTIPLTKALSYLHSKNIVYRDLKPCNIGFDTHGTLKLYDFGLAKEIREGRKLTMNTGTRFYMAPEVAFSTNYGLAADIYSLSLILWEVASLKIPFQGFTRETHTQKVLIDGVRPRVDYRCGSLQMQQLITKCWDQSPKSRPNPDEILTVLEAETSRKLVASSTNQERKRNSLRRSQWL